MSWLSDAVSGVQNSIPSVNGWAPTVSPIALSPITNVTPKKELTPEEQRQAQQVRDKMDAGFAAHAGVPGAELQYLKSLEDQIMRGFSSNVDDYKGKPTAERAAADVQRQLERNATQTANVNARLGKMGATKGADSMRIAVENSLTNQQNIDNIEAQAAWDEYQSKYDEMAKNYGQRVKMGGEAAQRQAERANAAAQGWQGQLGRFGKALVESGSAIAGGGAGAIMGGGGLMQDVMKEAGPGMRNTFGNVPVDALNLMIDPNESVRQIGSYWNKQAGKPNPTIIDPSRIKR